MGLRLLADFMVRNQNKSMQSSQWSAWNPGIESEIPAAYRELETIYDPANVFTTLDEVNELATETGLSPEELISFRPHRLVLHELIVRVTADIVVLEGEHEEDLGINFRNIARHIFSKYIIPALMQIEHRFDTMRTRIEDMTMRELEAALFQSSPAVKSKPPFWSRLVGTKQKPTSPVKSRQEREFELITGYKQNGLGADDELAAAVYRSLYRVLGSIATTRGFIGNDPQYLANICVRHACNYLGSRDIGRQVGEIVKNAIASEGYELIPDAEKPILISLKGPSAAGKSSLRPMLREMMSELGIEDHGYGTISPDIWRRLLLDYEALGESYKYAGRFTSHEINLIDSKLDHYIRAKADQRRSIPHLMVDRFRFDSFASEKITSVLHKTYVRYIDTMYMYFIVTPPEATVERGWERGLTRGRYKAVEDFLGHCVEAYAGMPKLLFKWLANKKPRYFFEFLDNSVPKGTYARQGADRTRQAGIDADFSARLVYRHRALPAYQRTCDEPGAGRGRIGRTGGSEQPRFFASVHRQNQPDRVLRLCHRYRFPDDSLRQFYRDRCKNIRTKSGG